MKAEYVKNTENDLMIVNAARVSFNKESSFRDNLKYFPMTDEENKSKHANDWFRYMANAKGADINNSILKIEDFGLIKYLNSANHFTPFTHSRMTFHSIDGNPFLDFSKMNADDMAGLVRNESGSKVRHSLWGWKNIFNKGLFLIDMDAYHVKKEIRKRYPGAFFAFFPDFDNEYEHVYESYKSVINYVFPSDETDENFIDITMRETVPIFVARQRFKHKIGFTENEVSRRYVDDTPEFFFPETWRKRPDKSVKQGSSEDETVQYIPWGDEVFVDGEIFTKLTDINDVYAAFTDIAQEFYEKLIESKVAPEQARMVLPQSMYTSYYVTGNIPSWKRAIGLRDDSHAQKEIRDLAQDWKHVLATLENKSNMSGYTRPYTDPLSSTYSPSAFLKALLDDI